ncbi:MAG: cell division protein FtsH, partial [Anaerolineae bacterium]|nr:cell division protein FtsH [Anaerolineae bacterium]
MHKDEGKQKIAMTMAGKAAEIIKNGEEGVSSGPAGDIQQASSLARAMVMRWGMSDRVGNIDYAEAHEGYQGNTAGFSVSAHTRERIGEGVKRLIDEGYETARRVLIEKAEDFERLARGLLEYETLTGDEIRKVIAGEPLGGDDDSAGSSPGGGLAAVIGVPKTKPKAPKTGPEPEPAV